MTRSDGFLAIGALVGLVVYVLFTPSQHPFASASYALSETGARQAAESFLAAKGYAVTGLDVDVRLRWERQLLNDLQADLGRPRTIDLLEAGDSVALPVFNWEVTFREPREEDDEDEDEGGYYAVLVTQQGRVCEFRQRPADPREEMPQGGPPVVVALPRPPTAHYGGQRVDRTALEAAFPTPPGTEGHPPVILEAATDSVLAATLAFATVDSLWHVANAARLPDVEAVQAQLNDAGGVRPGFGPEVAVALARHHLRDLPWKTADFRVDSVWVPAEREARVGHVRFAWTDPAAGQQVRTDVEVSAAGALYEMDLSFNPDRERPSSTFKTVVGVVEVILYVLLSLILIVSFFRRLVARLIDGKAALLDGLFVGVLMVVMMLLIRDVGGIQDVSNPALKLLIRALISMVSGAAVAVFVFLLSGATDSQARAVWPGKLRTSSLMRLGDYRNVYVGLAMLRGTALGFLLLGLLVLVLVIFPRAILSFDDSLGFLYEISYQPMVMHTASIGLTMFIVLLLVLLGIGTFVYRKTANAVVVVGMIMLAMMLMQGATVTIEPVEVSWALSALWGVALGVAFWHYDFVTCFVAPVVALLIWNLSEGWIVEGSQVWIDLALAGALVVGFLVLGLVGLGSGRARRDVGEYVPSYIEDLTQQERLKRELEIARQVQESFLPRRMPEVSGLDIAAMCLAALDIGGDYYDFVETEPGKLAVVVGDVSGKGTQAAFYMTLTKGIVQTLAHEKLGPAEVICRVNTIFCENVPRGTFISMIYGVLDVEARTFTFVRAGHNPVILKRSPNQEVEMLQPPGLAIGLVAGETFNQTIQEEMLHLRLGDVLVFYTDGFSEAMNSKKDLYGDDRLARKVSDVGQRSANEILRAVTEDVHHFAEAAGRHDDMTMVVVKLTRRAPLPVTGQEHMTAEA